MHILFILLLMFNAKAHEDRHMTLESQRPVLPKFLLKDQEPLIEYFFFSKKGKITKKLSSGKAVELIINRDKFGFRKTTEQHLQSYRTHLFFVGCSFTFGEGLSEEVTFPYIIAKEMPDLRVVNMGKMGASIFDHFYLWDSFNWKEVFPEEEGLMVVTVFSDHLERLKLTWRYLQWAQWQTPTYQINSQGQYVYAGMLRENWSHRWMKLLQGFNLSYLWLRGSAYFSDANLAEVEKEYAQALNDLKRRYLVQYPKGRFVVSWMENFPIGSVEVEKKFLDELTQLGIEFWGNKGSPNIDYSKWIIPDDGHPNEISNKAYARFLKSIMSVRRR